MASGETSGRNRPLRVAVVGGGITGLAAAHRLVELDPGLQVTLFERRIAAGRRALDRPRERLPGRAECGQLHHHGALGPGPLQAAGAGRRSRPDQPGLPADLCGPLGPALPSAGRFHDDGPHARCGRWRSRRSSARWASFARRWSISFPPARDSADESMAAFVRRRLGREVFDRLVEPLVSAVYAADMEKLSVLATLPRFREMESEYGSLIRAMRRHMKTLKGGRPAPSQSGARYSMFVTLRGGLTSLVDALAARLPPGTVRLETPVDRMTRQSDGWQLTPAGGSPEHFDAVILATPSHESARLLQPTDASLADDLGRIVHEGTAVVTVAYRRQQIGHKLDGIGFVVPAVERSPVLAGSFSSRKYVHRAPEGTELFRIFVGGARRPEMAEMEDRRLVPLVLGELKPLLQIDGEPIYVTTAHWPGTMPQYYVGHLDLIARIDQRRAAIPGLELAGNAFQGVGVPNCIHSGEQAAQRVVASSPLPPGEGWGEGSNDRQAVISIRFRASVIHREEQAPARILS